MQVVKKDTSTSVDVDYSLEEVEASNVELLQVGGGCLKGTLLLIVILSVIYLILIYVN
jgi:hypothetical protein